MLKTIASNTIAQLVAKFFSAALALLTTTLIIRLTGLELYGELTKLLVIIAIGFVFSDFGLNATALRQFNPKNLALQFRTLLFSRLILSLVVIVGLNLFVQFLPGGYTDASKSVFWIGSLAILFQGIYTSCNALFQYRQNYWHSTLATVVGVFATAALTLYFTFYSPTLFNFLLANTSGCSLMALLAYLFAAPPKPQAKPSIASLYQNMRVALPIATMLILSVIASKVDTIILGVHTQAVDVGQYGLAYRFFDVILVLPVFLMNALYPQLLQSSPIKRRALTLKTTFSMMVMGIIVALLVYYLSPLLLLIKIDAHLAVTSLKLLSLSIPAFFITAPLMWYQVAMGREQSNLKIYALATLLNLSLNLHFIPHSGVVAAAIVTGVTELFILICLLSSSLSKKD